mmetsp:Transcript_161308/g.517844  ORF Transcript_161308/g.517844 Transcript_161308/m.517844 type:complete len:388 (+) Transcript_161308:287-1450(+)
MPLVLLEGRRRRWQRASRRQEHTLQQGRLRFRLQLQLWLRQRQRLRLQLQLRVRVRLQLLLLRLAVRRLRRRDRATPKARRAGEGGRGGRGPCRAAAAAAVRGGTLCRCGDGGTIAQRGDEGGGGGGRHSDLSLGLQPLDLLLGSPQVLPELRLRPVRGGELADPLGAFGGQLRRQVRAPRSQLLHLTLGLCELAARGLEVRIARPAIARLGQAGGHLFLQSGNLLQQAQMLLRRGAGFQLQLQPLDLGSEARLLPQLALEPPPLLRQRLLWGPGRELRAQRRELVLELGLRLLLLPLALQGRPELLHLPLQLPVLLGLPDVLGGVHAGYRTVSHLPSEIPNLGLHQLQLLLVLHRRDRLEVESGIRLGVGRLRRPQMLHELVHLAV